MSERGFFLVDRGIFDHEFFADEPFTEREAWIWLIGAAVWKDTDVRVGKFRASLKRGQCAFSIRFLAAKWQWSKSRVDRFLKRLKNEDSIGTAARTGVTVITICNYNEYQLASPSVGTAIIPKAGQQRDKEESIKERKKDAAGQESPPAPPLEHSEEADLFRRGKEVLGPKAGGLIVKLLVRFKKKVPLARAAIEQASTKQDPREYLGRILAGPPQTDFKLQSGIEGIV